MLRVADRPPAVYRDGPPNLAQLLHPPPWHADALCKEHPELDWFPGPGESTSRQKKVCAKCLVRVECREAAGTDRYVIGIWGGLTGYERRMTGKLVSHRRRDGLPTVLPSMVDPPSDPTPTSVRRA